MPLVSDRMRRLQRACQKPDVEACPADQESMRASFIKIVCSDNPCEKLDVRRLSNGSGSRRPSIPGTPTFAPRSEVQQIIEMACPCWSVIDIGAAKRKLEQVGIASFESFDEVLTERGKLNFLLKSHNLKAFSNHTLSDLRRHVAIERERRRQQVLLRARRRSDRERRLSAASSIASLPSESTEALTAAEVSHHAETQSRIPPVRAGSILRSNGRAFSVPNLHVAMAHAPTPPSRDGTPVQDQSSSSHEDFAGNGTETATIAEACDIVQPTLTDEDKSASPGKQEHAEKETHSCASSTAANLRRMSCHTTGALSACHSWEWPMTRPEKHKRVILCFQKEVEFLQAELSHMGVTDE